MTTTDEHKIAAAAAQKYHTDAENLLAVRKHAKDAIRRAIEGKEIDVAGLPTLLEFQVDALWASAERQADATTKTIRKPRKDGTQGALNYGDEYDQMIVVCRGRRTTLGRMTAEDRRLMAVESADNRAKIDKADDDEQAAAAADVLALRPFADYASFDKHRKEQGDEEAS